MNWAGTRKRVVFWTAAAIILEIVVVLWPLVFSVSDNEYMAIWRAILRGEPIPGLIAIGRGIGVGLAAGLIGGVGFGIFGNLVGGDDFDNYVGLVYGICLGIFGVLIGGALFSIGIGLGSFIGYCLGRH